MFTMDLNGILREESLDRFPWLVHGFGGRREIPAFSEFQAAAVRQVHSRHVVVVRGEGGALGEGDALVTSQAGILLTIRTADCVPVLLVDPVSAAVAAVHAGWRGIVAGILPRAVEVMEAEFGTRPDALLAAIGPCIRQESYEVGPEVAEQFQSLFPERGDLRGRARVDLAGSCARQLVRAGVREQVISDCGRCTYRDSALFHSYRRDREAAGRMTAFVGIRHPSPS